MYYFCEHITPIAVVVFFHFSPEDGSNNLLAVCAGFTLELKIEIGGKKKRQDPAPEIMNEPCMNIHLPIFCQLYIFTPATGLIKCMNT